MSDWLERELARGLTRATAPDALGERLGLVRPSRSEFRGAVLAVAAAVIAIVGGGYAAGQSTTIDLYRFTKRDLAAVQPIELASAQTVSRISWNVREGAGHPARCDGAEGGIPVRTAAMTALLAHHGGSEDRLQNSGDSGCGFCHSL